MRGSEGSRSKLASIVRGRREDRISSSRVSPGYPTRSGFKAFQHAPVLRASASQPVLAKDLGTGERAARKAVSSSAAGKRPTAEQAEMLRSWRPLGSQRADKPASSRRAEKSPAGRLAELLLTERRNT